MEESFMELENVKQWDSVNVSEVFEKIRKGLEHNYKNYRLYQLLGRYYEHKNVNQAWLCYENAEFYCDNQEDLERIKSQKQKMEQSPEWCVKICSIVILSYNQLEMTKQCLDSIRKHNPRSAYELVIVDNASELPVREWLKEQEDIKLILNEENKGFPLGCNQGIKIADPEADIFLLNNDTVIMPNSIFWLRMGLYEDSRVGAVGSRTNYAANYQMIEEKYDSVEEYEAFAIKNNLPMLHPYEEKNWLVGYALLLKRQALDEVGLFDLRFSPGNYEDTDLGYRIKKAGYTMRLCWNSFIYHYGHGGGGNAFVWSPVLGKNHQKFIEKWGFSEETYHLKRADIMSLIQHEKDAPIRVLDVGCGLGTTMSAIKQLWPQSQVYGIELHEKIAGMTALTFDVLQGNVEDVSLPYEKEMFDYILFGDVLEELYDPQKVLEKLAPYLKKDGKYICSVLNAMNAKVLLKLLNGNFEYEKEGIADRRNIRFFSLDSIAKMAAEAGLDLEYVVNSYRTLTPEEESLVQYLKDFPGRTVDYGRYQVYRYLIRMKKKEQ